MLRCCWCSLLTRHLKRTNSGGTKAPSNTRAIQARLRATLRPSHHAHPPVALGSSLFRPRGARPRTPSVLVAAPTGCGGRAGSRGGVSLGGRGLRPVRHWLSSSLRAIIYAYLALLAAGPGGCWSPSLCGACVSAAGGSAVGGFVGQNGLMGFVVKSMIRLSLAWLPLLVSTECSVCDGQFG